MSAADIIELIKKLPPNEQAEVAVFVRSTTFETAPQPKVATDADFERAAQRVFKENEELLRRLAQ